MSGEIVRPNPIEAAVQDIVDIFHNVPYGDHGPEQFDFENGGSLFRNVIHRDRSTNMVLNLKETFCYVLDGSTGSGIDKSVMKSGDIEPPFAYRLYTLSRRFSGLDVCNQNLAHISWSINDVNRELRSHGVGTEIFAGDLEEEFLACIRLIKEGSDS